MIIEDAEEVLRGLKNINDSMEGKFAKTKILFRHYGNYRQRG